eukprot:TRINITY_DN1590_c0_g1_i2.p1 TRINITY_DN1590_c0_g1~~TRINITY_DN1590_c0_g1_i2.p1  ORF type:complete len:617 (+),score=255.22 TRINITY_DN1590_c0_g1_i2:296-2146(+)
MAVQARNEKIMALLLSHPSIEVDIESSMLNASLISKVKEDIKRNPVSFSSFSKSPQTPPPLSSSSSSSAPSRSECACKGCTRESNPPHPFCSRSCGSGTCGHNLDLGQRAHCACRGCPHPSNPPHAFCSRGCGVGTCGHGSSSSSSSLSAVPVTPVPAALLTRMAPPPPPASAAQPATPSSKSIESFSTESLVDLLKKVGFSDQTCGAFADQQIDGNIVGTMTDEMIAEEMEIQEIKERKRLIYFFQRIVKEGLDWTSDSISTHRFPSSSSAAGQAPSVDKILSHNDDLFGEVIQWDPEQVGQWILSTPSIASIQPAFSQLGISGLVLLMLTDKDIDTFKTLKIGERQKLKEALREIKSSNRRKGRQESRLNDVDLLGSFSVKEFLHGFNPSVSCVASLRANINALNFPGLAELVTRIEAHAREKAPTKKPPGLSDDEFFALIAYTFENKGGVNIYQRLSQCLRSHNPIQIKNNTISEELKGWKVLLFYLISALLKLPKVAKNCFRGMTIADPSFMETIKINYSVGRQIEWFGFSSTSTNKDVSMGFIIGQGILFCIKTLKGKDLRMFSVYAQEEEVLMLPNSKFVVASPATRDPQNPNIWIIEMVEVDDQVPFFG